MRINPEGLRALRERSGFTVSAFATAVGIASSHLSNIEAGRRQASSQVVQRMARTLKVPVTALIIDPAPEPEELAS